jgi:hypothetical protein
MLINHKFILFGIEGDIFPTFCLLSFFPLQAMLLLISFHTSSNVMQVGRAATSAVKTELVSSPTFHMGSF